MAFTLVDSQVFGFADGGTANGSTGHDITLPGGGSTANGDWDVIFVGSDTTVTTPAGFSVTSTFVNNQGGYAFTRKSTGGDGPTVRIKTTGDFNTTVGWQRWRGGNTIDVATNAHIDSSGAATNPAVSTGTLAQANELVTVASTNTDFQAGVPTTPVWSSGYTDAGSVAQGTSTSGAWLMQAWKTGAGTAAETPSVTWTNGCRNRYIFVVTITQASGTNTTITDTSSGAGEAGSADTVAIGRTIQDGSSGAGEAGSTDTVVIDRVIADGSSGAAEAGSPDTLAIGRTITDTSSGAAAADSGGTLAVDKVLADSSGGAAAAGSADTVAQASNLVIQDVSGGAGAGSTFESPTTSQVVHDKMVMPVLTNALTCLTTEAGKVASPPAFYQMRPGATFVAQADDRNDECCQGIAWVRPGTMWAVDPSGPFPQQQTGSDRNPPGYWAVQLELGIERCLPTQGDGDGAMVTGAQWQAATQAAMDDAAALRRAVCCLQTDYGYDAIVPGQLVPLENEANCTGNSIVVTVRVPACDCLDAG